MHLANNASNAVKVAIKKHSRCIIVQPHVRNDILHAAQLLMKLQAYICLLAC